MLPFLLYPVFSTIMLKEFARMIHMPLFLDSSDPIAPFYRVKNAITGREIEDVVFADTRCGLYETLQRDPRGNVVIQHGSPVYCLHYAPIYFERINPDPAWSMQQITEAAEGEKVAISGNSIYDGAHRVDVVVMSGRRQSKRSSISNHLAEHRRSRFEVINGGRA